MPLIEATDLVLGYERHAIAEGISFTVNKGDYICIVGENGSGKSTLMKTLLGLTAPLDGKFLFGENLRKNEIGYLPQQTVVQKDFPASVTEIVLSGFEGRMGLRPFHTKAEKEAAERNMDRMGISHLAKSCYRNLSGGQQQRVLLARALCATERVLLLDEPVSGLDPNVTVEMYELIGKLNREGLTIIMISHDVTAALQYASHILHIGESVFFGTRDEYLKTPEGKLYIEFSESRKTRKEAGEGYSDKAGQRGETII